MGFDEGDHYGESTQFSQCRLKRANQEYVVWIPSEFAVVGKVLKIKENGEWVDGWRVIGAGTNILSEEDLDDFVRTATSTVRGWKNRDLVVRRVVARLDERYG